MTGSRSPNGEEAGAEVSPLATGWAYGPVGGVVRSLLQHLVLFPMMHLVTPIRVRGRERFRAVDPPVLVVSNHVSHFDTPTIVYAIPASIRRHLAVAAARDYFYRGKVRGALVSLSLATVPFDRHEDSRGSLLRCEDLLRRGWSLLIFPEGTRNPSGKLGTVRHGAAVLAVETGRPVVPLFVHGLAQVLPKGTVAPLPAGVLVDVGEAIRPAPTDSVEAVRTRIEEALSDLAARRPLWGATAGRDPRASDPEPRGAGEG